MGATTDTHTCKTFTHVKEIFKSYLDRVVWPVIVVLGGLRQADWEFQPRLGYHASKQGGTNIF